MLWLYLRKNPFGIIFEIKINIMVKKAKYIKIFFMFLFNIILTLFTIFIIFFTIYLLEYSFFRNRLMFPIWDRNGKVVAFSARLLEGEGPKYVNSPELVTYKKGETLYAFHLAKKAMREKKACILCEGNMDVISLQQAGFVNTVAPLGTAFTLDQAKLLSRYTKEIVVTLDSDAAGQKAVMRALETMKDSGMPIRVLVLPECKDPDEYIKKNGAARFKMLLEGAVSEIEYRLLRAADNIDLHDDNAKIK